jgi:hypothetical protein
MGSAEHKGERTWILSESEATREKDCNHECIRNCR